MPASSWRRRGGRFRERLPAGGSIAWMAGGTGGRDAKGSGHPRSRRPSRLGGPRFIGYWKPTDRRRVGQPRSRLLAYFLRAPAVALQAEMAV
jgi:hypothetical protein